MPDLTRVLDSICPMHLQLTETGQISHAGPTLRKMRPSVMLDGVCFFDLFEVRRPKAVTDMTGLMGIRGAKLHIRFRDPPCTAMKALLVPSPHRGGAIVNLSFGISVPDGVRDYNLSNADFAATDLTIEMLYLLEAKSAAMEASRQLNQRLKVAMIAAQERAFTDTLTGLRNRRALDHILQRLSVSKAPFALIHLDLDFFKAVNDTMGHAAGDQVLQWVARIMVDETREHDTVARIGGDEFVILLAGMTDPQHLAEFGRRLIARIEKPIPVDGAQARISASLGTLVIQGGDACEVDTLLRQADLALYASKKGGRGVNTFFDPRAHREDGPCDLASPKAEAPRRRATDPGDTLAGLT